MKKIKKFMALFVCAAMTAMCLSACGNSGSNAPQSGTQEAASGETAEAGKEEAPASAASFDGDTVKIGFIGWGYTDTLGASYKTYFEYMGDAFGIEFNLVAGFTQDEQISLAESLIESGVQGILAYQVTSPMMELCERNGVYLMQFGSPITDPDIQATLDASEYWLGTSAVDDYASGENMVAALAEAGCKNMVVLGSAAGNPCHDLRWDGIMDKAKEVGMKVVGEYRSSGADAAQQYSDQVQNFVAMYPEMDCIAMTGASSGNLDAVLSALDTTGKTGEIKLATLDVQDGTDAYLEEGSLLFIGGGQHPEVVFLSIAMADIIRGNLDMGGEEVALVGQFINIVGTDGYQTFKEYIMDDVPFYIDELQAVSPTFNPDATYQDLYKLWNSYNIDDVMARHAK